MLRKRRTGWWESDKEKGRRSLGFKVESPQVVCTFTTSKAVLNPDEAGVSRPREQSWRGRDSVVFRAVSGPLFSLSVFPLMAQRADWVLFCLLSFCHPPVQCGLPEEEICLLVGGRANLISVEEPP